MLLGMEDFYHRKFQSLFLFVFFFSCMSKSIIWVYNFKLHVDFLGVMLKNQENLTTVEAANYFFLIFFSVKLGENSL